MYDPSTARFLTKDPLEEKGGDPNLYAYCANDPVNNTDPSGQQEQGVGFSWGYPIDRVLAELDKGTNPTTVIAWANGQKRTLEFIVWAYVENSKEAYDAVMASPTEKARLERAAKYYERFSSSRGKDFPSAQDPKAVPAIDLVAEKDAILRARPAISGMVTASHNPAHQPQKQSDQGFRLAYPSDLASLAPAPKSHRDRVLELIAEGNPVLAEYIKHGHVAIDVEWRRGFFDVLSDTDTRTNDRGRLTSIRVRDDVSSARAAAEIELALYYDRGFIEFDKNRPPEPLRIGPAPSISERRARLLRKYAEAVPDTLRQRRAKDDLIADKYGVEEYRSVPGVLWNFVEDVGTPAEISGNPMGSGWDWLPLASLAPQKPSPPRAQPPRTAWGAPIEPTGNRSAPPVERNPFPFSPPQFGKTLDSESFPFPAATLNAGGYNSPKREWLRIVTRNRTTGDPMEDIQVQHIANRIAEDPVASAAYAQIRSTGREVVLDFGKPPAAGTTGSAMREVVVYVRECNSIQEAIATIVHESNHLIRMHRRQVDPFRGYTQMEEYRAFRRETLYRLGRRPTLDQRAELFQNDVLSSPYYQQLPSGNIPPAVRNRLPP